MRQMEEFDSTLRAAIEAGGDKAVQFIRKAQDGTIVPCSPNKILVSTTQTLRPQVHKRLLPIGFQSGFRTGANGIAKAIERLDAKVEQLVGFDADQPVLIPVATAHDLLRIMEPTLLFEDEDDALPFDWEAAHAALGALERPTPGQEQTRPRVVMGCGHTQFCALSRS